MMSDLSSFDTLSYSDESISMLSEPLSLGSTACLECIPSGSRVPLGRSHCLAKVECWLWDVATE